MAPVIGVLVVLAAQSLWAPPAAGQDSSAVAVNQRDGSSVFKLSFSVKRVMDSEVDADNAAVAYASCTECQTVATSIQVVLVMDDPESVTTDNVAIALNYQCSECETLAAAYQYVFGDGEPVRFSAEGNQRLADIRRRFQELRRRDDLTLQQLADEIALLAAEVAEVVDEELVPTGKAGAPGQQQVTTTTTSSTAVVTSTTSTVGATTTSVAAATTTTVRPATTTTTSTG
jgi:putative peptide zinc metalloprotease protein